MAQGSAPAGCSPEANIQGAAIVRCQTARKARYSPSVALALQSTQQAIANRRQALEV